MNRLRIPVAVVVSLLATLPAPANASDGFTCASCANLIDPGLVAACQICCANPTQAFQGCTSGTLFNPLTCSCATSCPTSPTHTQACGSVCCPQGGDCCVESIPGTTFSASFCLLPGSSFFQPSQVTACQGLSDGATCAITRRLKGTCTTVAGVRGCLPPGIPPPTCALVCPAGQTQCGGSCVDLQSDLNHCGSCANACPSGEICSGGACACAAGLTRCGGSCVDLQTDANNCGGCGTACPSGQVCTGGVCACPTGLTLCGGSCVDLQTDSNNCGSCGNACPNGGCSGGACPCTPTTCAAAGADCGDIPDGCGGLLFCGSCASPSTCGGSGVPNVCSPPCGNEVGAICCSGGTCDSSLGLDCTGNFCSSCGGMLERCCNLVCFVGGCEGSCTNGLICLSSGVCGG